MTNCFTTTASLLSRLASHSSACCSSSTTFAAGSASGVLVAPLVASQLRGLAGFVKAGGGNNAAVRKKSGSRGGGGDDNPLLKPILPLLAQPERQPAQLRKGDLAAEAAYKRARTAEHHAWIKDMTTKFKLQQAAMKALPERLQKLAMVPDQTPFPLDRKCLFDTAPEEYRDPSPAAAGGVGADRKAEL